MPIQSGHSDWPRRIKKLYNRDFGLSVSNTVRLLLFLNQGNAKTDLFLSNWTCVCFYVQERILKNVEL